MSVTYSNPDSISVLASSTVLAVAKAYGTSPEGPNPPGRKYSPNLDINDDGKIEIKDYYIVCKHYGEEDP